MPFLVPSSLEQPAYNIYCDESCHLEHDQQKAMVLGAVWCPFLKHREISRRLRELRRDHGLGQEFEAKWTKVSPSKLSFYRAILDYFFDDDDLHFRALVVPDKSLLKHEEFGQTHDEWYYKMYFIMLKAILSPGSRYFIYLDIKDTRSRNKVRKLDEVLRNNYYDFNREIIGRLQTVRSHEVAIMQLTDLLVGAVSYINRGLRSSNAKTSLIERIRERSHYSLTRTTLNQEAKFNLLIWQARESTNGD